MKLDRKNSFGVFFSNILLIMSSLQMFHKKAITLIITKAIVLRLRFALDVNFTVKSIALSSSLCPLSAQS